ncbi:unnamed protein product [Coccothraustes coccothraustes]
MELELTALHWGIDRTPQPVPHCKPDTRNPSHPAENPSCTPLQTRRAEKGQKPSQRREGEGQGELPRSIGAGAAAARALKSVVPGHSGLCLTRYCSRSAGLRSLSVL